MNNNTVIKQDKLLFINQIILLVGGISYSLLYMLGGDIIIGITIIISLGLLFGAVQLSRKKFNPIVTVYIITFSQFALIVLFGLAGSEFAGGYPLIASVIAFNCIYYVKRIIIIQWVMTDIVIIVSFFFWDALYPGLTTSFVIRGILGINFSILFMYFLLNWGIRFLAESIEKEKKSEELLEQLEIKMQEQRVNAQKIQNTFNVIKERSDNLKHTSAQMLDVASDLSSSADNQNIIVQNLTTKSSEMVEEIKSTQQMAIDSSDMVSQSATKLETSNKNMRLAVDTISQMEESSQQIISIINSIENIAFQTNILALNAAIEAARAGGDAGKGFAVVAEEVQTLATKSSEAANASSVLVNATIENIQSGAKFIREAAENMNEVIDSSNAAAEKVNDINDIIAAQVTTVEEILAQMNDILLMISQTTQTASNSNDMANDISNEINYINEAISNG